VEGKSNVLYFLTSLGNPTSSSHFPGHTPALYPHQNLSHLHSLNISTLFPLKASISFHLLLVYLYLDYNKFVEIITSILSYLHFSVPASLPTPLSCSHLGTV
jgi:hypothetical protein